MPEPPPDPAHDSEYDARCRQFVQRFVQDADLRHLKGLRGMVGALRQSWDMFSEADRREIVRIMSNQADILWPELNSLRQEAKLLVGDWAANSNPSAFDVSVPIRVLDGAEDLPLPAYKTEGAVGMDLYAAVRDPATLAPGERAAVPAGIAIAVPFGYEAQVRARSGLAKNQGIALVNAPGTIDCDYRGEVAVLLVNLGAESFTISRGDRIAQLVIAPVARARWEPVTILEDTVRGAGGFGHTGRQA